MNNLILEIMGKSIAGKAFSIRFFLNKGVKPIQVKGKKKYALYAQVNYDYRNTKVPIFDPSAFYLSHTELQELPKPIYLYEAFFNDAVALYLEEIPKGAIKGDINYKENLDYFADYILPKVSQNIEKVARLENSASEFELKGLGKRLQLYYRPLGEFFQETISKDIESFLSQDDVKLYFQDDDEPIYMEGNSIGRGMTVLRFIDWFFVDFNYDFQRSVPTQLKTDVELFLLMAGAKVGYHPLIEWLGEEHHLESLDRFFTNNTDLFDSTKELRINLSNYFSRYISLVPPSLPKNIYLSLVNQLVREYTDKIQSLITQ
jgi:hypothetical protein